MVTFHEEQSALPRVQLRGLLARLERIRAGALHDALVARAHATIARIRSTQSARAATPRAVTDPADTATQVL
jgi:hypothetical protein